MSPDSPARQPLTYAGCPGLLQEDRTSGVMRVARDLAQIDTARILVDAGCASRIGTSTAEPRRVHHVSLLAIRCPSAGPRA